MNTRRRQRVRCLLKLFNTSYIVRHPVPYILVTNRLNMEFTYTKTANREMRATKCLGLPNRKEFKKMLKGE